MDTQQTQQVIDMVQNSINSLSAQLGVSLPQLWEVMIRQQYVEAVQSFVGFIVSGVALYVCLRFIQKNWEVDTPEPIALIVVFATALSGFIFLISTFGCIDGIGQIANPEYYAIQDIANFIKN